MPKNKYYGKPKRNYYGGARKRKSKYNEVEKTAYMMGLVKRGLKNPDSKVTESYNKGINSAERQKKSLF